MEIYVGAINWPHLSVSLSLSSLLLNVFHFRTILRCTRLRLFLVLCSAPSVPQSVFTSTEKAPTRAFSWLRAPTNAFTFKTLLRHYAKRGLTPRSLNVKLGPRRKGHKGRAVWLA